jgi:DHA2 family multidrug resistance protein
MQGVDNSILNVALPHIQGSLSASLDQIAWALTSYIVCAAIMMPDRLARRPLRHQIYLSDLGHWLHARLGTVRRRHQPR